MLIFQNEDEYGYEFLWGIFKHARGININDFFEEQF